MSVARKSPLPLDDLPVSEIATRLRGVAAKFDPALRERVSRLLFAAAETILQLQEMDLVRFEADADAGPHHLAMWEELAPVMGDSVESANRMIAVGEQTFPLPAESDEIEGLDDAFGPSSGSAAPGSGWDSPDAAIAKLVAAVTSALRRDVAYLGERLRKPTIVADSWNLISDLLEFRGKLRAGVGELIFQIASSIEHARREDVIPGYAADLEQALLLRQAATSLSFLFRGHARRVASAPEDKLAATLQDALKDVHAFSRTRGLAAMRTSDKRIFLEARAQLFALSKERPLRARETKQATDNLARFLDSLSVISRRETLRLHDRAQLAALQAELSRGRAVKDPLTLRGHLERATALAATLYGRDAHLDAYLRAQRHFPASSLADGELPAEAARFAKIAAAVAVP
jgi:hypothetical protein